MNRIVLGAAGALALAGLGLFWLQGRAQVERGAPPPEPPAADAPTGLPSADISGLRGPEPPEVSELTREQQRFYRYDRNRDGIITREEMMASRTAAFRKLDKDGNNLLTFEEWAVATSDRFAGADANGDGRLSPAEFATTAPKPAPRPTNTCAC
jgi:hypothetical protein